MSSLGLWSGASTPSTDVNPEPNIPNWHGPWPNISNRRRPQAKTISAATYLCLVSEININQRALRPNIYIRRQGSHDFRQVIDHLRCQTPRILPNFPNRHQGTTNCSQLLPRIPENFQLTTGIWNPVLWTLCSSLKYCLPMVLWHARQDLFSVVSLKDCLSIFYGRLSCTYFYR